MPLTEPESSLSKTVALIPARGGSRGVPRKNLARVGGKSLIQRAIEVAMEVRQIDEVIVSSDCDEILQEAQRFGASVVRRPGNLADDDAQTSAVVEHFLSHHLGVSLLVLLQPTSPLREPQDVEACLAALAYAPAAATIVAVAHPAEWMFGLAPGGALRPLIGNWETLPSRRQDARSCYQLNGAVYAARVAHLRAGRPLVGAATVGIPMPVARSIDIDTPHDLAFADYIAGLPKVG